MLMTTGTAIRGCCCACECAVRSEEPTRECLCIGSFCHPPARMQASSHRTSVVHPVARTGWLAREQDTLGNNIVATPAKSAVWEHAPAGPYLGRPLNHTACPCHRHFNSTTARVKRRPLLLCLSLIYHSDRNSSPPSTTGTPKHDADPGRVRLLSTSSLHSLNRQRAQFLCAFSPHP